MSNQANQCPKCNNYIFGEYCYMCDLDIRNYYIEHPELPEIFKEIFKEKDE